MSEYSDLREAALKAKKGPWAWYKPDLSMSILHGADPLEDVILSCSGCEACLEGGSNCSEPKEDNATYIALASPDRILALLDKLERVESELERQMARRAYY